MTERHRKLLIRLESESLMDGVTDTDPDSLEKAGKVLVRSESWMYNLA